MSTFWSGTSYLGCTTVEVWVYGACAKPRNITQEQLMDGAQIIGAATAVEALVTGAQTLSFNRQIAGVEFLNEEGEKTWYSKQQAW